MQTPPEKSRRTRDTLLVFLRPALFVMNRLRYPQKFAVISLLLAFLTVGVRPVSPPLGDQ